MSTSASAQDYYDPDTVRDIYLTFKQSNWWQLLLNNKAQKIDISADMVVDNQTYTNVGVRFRGQTSYKWLPPAHEKKSFNIRTDAFVSGQDLYGYSNLNLNNGFHDPSFMREFLAYMIARRYGIAPKCNFVRLHLNNVYWGIYVNVQQPNSDMMKEWFGKNDSNRYRGFPSVGNFGNGRCALTWLGNNVQAYRDAYEVKQGDAMDLMNLCDVLNNTPTNQLQAALRKVFSVDQFYRYAIVMNAMLQTDSYIGSGKDHFLWV
ncbi:MAG: CotH kinase family protein, partial [Planctomycetota bacterium]|nr:CotH kinase family protein [Planctomycetota bacterium]